VKETGTRWTVDAAMLGTGARVAAIDLNLTSHTRDVHEPLPTIHSRHVLSHFSPESNWSLIAVQARHPPCSPHEREWVRPNMLLTRTTQSTFTRSDHSTDSWQPASAQACGSSYVFRPHRIGAGLTVVVDVPREEGRPGAVRLEAPLGPLNASKAEVMERL
jgi:hypothetical protein